MNLKEYLMEYRALTLDIIEEVNNLGNIKPLVNERENILCKVKELDFTQEEICKVANDLKLTQLESEMHMAIKKEQVNIKRKIAELKKKEMGNTQYLSYGNRGYMGFGGFDKRS